MTCAVRFLLIKFQFVTAMAKSEKKLVIVESPTKTKTLSKYLGSEYDVAATKGHIKDLPKKDLGVDVENKYEPNYKTVPRQKKTVGALKKKAAGFDTVYLATDPDREGEAIAAHSYEILSGLDKKLSFKRVRFHEITESAVQDSFSNPGKIDQNLVDAQKARRVLDRLVGYKLSPLLWEKIRYGLSAGRVQSVALRLLVEREKEREEFKLKKYWTVTADLVPESTNKHLEAELVKIKDKNIHLREKIDLFAGSYSPSLTTINSAEQAKKIVKDLQGEDYKIADIEKKKTKRSPNPPFITASMQRAASSIYSFSGKRTMRAAQSLYEQGLITYHRTDSTYVAKKAINEIRNLIGSDYGSEYLPEKPRYYKTKSKAAQEAHEAIRPTDVSKKKALEKMGKDAKKLYNLIWSRTVASQMTDAVFESTTLTVKAGDYTLETKGSVLVFDGYLKAVGTSREDTLLPDLSLNEELEADKVFSEEKETSPPPRYTEAGLIRDLEKFGIGRPSTYAPIVGTIVRRGYVSRDGNYLIPEDTGFVVTNLLVDHFSQIVDLDFTAKMEEDLDSVAEGKEDWVKIIDQFYKPFIKKLEEKKDKIQKEDYVVLEQTDEKCPECGSDLVVKLGKYGKFLSCSNFPDCEYARPYDDRDKDGKPDDYDHKQLEGKCPECGGELVLKEGRFGKFVACANYPDCKYTRNYLDKIGMECPECGEGEVIEKKTRKGKTFWGCSRYPECEWASWKDPRGK